MQSHTHSHCERCLGRGGQGGVVAIWARNNVSIPNHGRQNPVACFCLPSNLLSPPHPTGFPPATLHFRCSPMWSLIPTSMRAGSHLRGFALAVGSAWSSVPPDVCMVCSLSLFRPQLSPERPSLTSLTEAGPLPSPFPAFVSSVALFAVCRVSLSMFPCLLLVKPSPAVSP